MVAAVEGCPPGQAGQLSRDSVQPCLVGVAVQGGPQDAYGDSQLRHGKFVYVISSENVIHLAKRVDPPLETRDERVVHALSFECRSKPG